MNPRPIKFWIGTFALLPLALAGCLKRKEYITVQQDGGVAMRLQYETDSLDELENGDAMPSTRAGWKVEQTVELKDDGDETHTLVAEQSFPPGAKLPQNYAAPEDPHADLYLQFPTTLTSERRPDGTYYHFRRTYSPRPWAQIDALQQQARETDKHELERIEQKEPSEMTHEDRVTLVQLALYHEMNKTRAFARRAWQDVAPDATQDAWLTVDSQLKTYFGELDFDRLAKLLESAETEDSDELVEAEAQAIENEATERMQAALADNAALRPRQLAAFKQRFAWYKKQYEVTEDLGDEDFEIYLTMPGEIVATNADGIDGNEAHWEVNGKMFRDRTVEIMATSRVTD